MYVRLTKTVADQGKLVPESSVEDHVDNLDIDWYVSAYSYGEDALEYFNENKSIKGFNGDAYTKTLHWDLDAENNFNLVKDSTIKLYEKLVSLGLGEGVQIYFSGNKGFHLLLHTENKFTPTQTKIVCHNLAVEAGVDLKVFDSTVYNITRIFRLEFTKHPKSGLYKIPITIEELRESTKEDIQELAKTNTHWENTLEAHPVQADFLKELYPEPPKIERSADVLELPGLENAPEDFNIMDCPPDKRRCIYALENGFFGPGERENATIRLAAYYKGKGWDPDRIFTKITNALQLRANLFPEANIYKDADTWRNIDQVFSDGWQGGTYSCKSDDFLASKCDVGNGPCSLEAAEGKRPSVVGVGGLIEAYKAYGEEAGEDFPKLGIEWLDSKVRIRPKNYSVINGASGSGKTSVLLQVLESLNDQKIYHLFFSADMADTSLFEKLAVKYTDYSHNQVEEAFNIHTADYDIQNEIITVLKDKLPYTLFDFTSSLNMEYIKNTIIKLKEDPNSPLPIQIVFIDYAGRIIGSKDSEYANATETATKANDVAKRANVHISFISQIPREQGDHTKAIRSSRVSKSSGAWEENATFAINVWRPFGDGVDNLDHYMHLYIAKSRTSTLEERVFMWDGRRGVIREMTDQEFTTYETLCETHNKSEPKPQVSLLQLETIKSNLKDKDTKQIPSVKIFNQKGNNERRSSDNQGLRNSGASITSIARSKE